MILDVSRHMVALTAMESEKTRILVVDHVVAGGDAVGWSAPGLERHARSRGLAAATIGLASGDIRLLVLDERLPEPDLRSLVAAGKRHGAMAVLAVAAATVASCQRALSAGCRGVLQSNDGRDQVERLHLLADECHRQFLLDRQDFTSLNSRYEALRERTAQQAERFQEIQETFFLDLSRVMTIISNIMDGIVFVDRDGNVTLLNPAAEDLLGVKAFAAVGKPMQDMRGRSELHSVLIVDHQKMADQREVVQTVEVHHSEQDLLYIKCITSRVFDYRGQPAGSLTVLKDVTAEFKTDQLKNQYLSIVAHELRTPLTGIKTFSTMMVKGSLGPLTDRQHRVVESIREQSDRLEHQIDKLINLGHLESDEYGQDREAFGVGDLCAGMLSPFEQPARDRHITLSIRCDVDDQQAVHADRADLRRACQALIENAIKFTSDGGSVEVNVRRDDNGRARFCVRDSGIGIDPRYHRRIFEKFFQVEDPLTRHHGGAGLGLFVAKGIVEAHGSRIEVSSKLGDGAEFSFVLPEHATAAPLAVASNDPLKG